MTKLDLILENIRDEYMINLLEEGESSELQTLKTKKFLNENLNRIRGMLVEEGTLNQVQELLENRWATYLSEAIDRDAMRKEYSIKSNAIQQKNRADLDKQQTRLGKNAHNLNKPRLKENKPVGGRDKSKDNVKFDVSNLKDAAPKAARDYSHNDPIPTIHSGPTGKGKQGNYFDPKTSLTKKGKGIPQPYTTKK